MRPQVHRDVKVPDLDEAEAAVLALGATKAEHQPETTFRVYPDPAGHPLLPPPELTGEKRPGTLVARG